MRLLEIFFLWGGHARNEKGLSDSGGARCFASVFALRTADQGYEYSFYTGIMYTLRTVGRKMNY